MDHRKLLMETLVMLARQPDRGANLVVAGQRMVEHLKRVGSNKEAQRLELEWMQKAICERVEQNGSSKLFEHIQGIINTLLSRLDD